MENYPKYTRTQFDNTIIDELYNEIHNDTDNVNLVKRFMTLTAKPVSGK